MIRVRLERWKDIPDYEGFYQVSNLGKVKSLTRVVIHNRYGSSFCRQAFGRTLSLYKEKSGYLSVGLSKNGVRQKYLVHQLVLLAFKGPCPKGQQTRHINDNNRANNTLWNLEYGTRKQNSADKIRHGKSLRGEKCSRAVLTEPQVRFIKNSLIGAIPIKEIALQYGVGYRCIWHIKRGNSWYWV